MRIAFTLGLLLFSISQAFAQPLASCGTRSPSWIERQIIRVQSPGPFVSSNQVIEIPVHVHAIGRSREAWPGVSDRSITEQIEILNRAYAPSGFHFNLVSVDRTYNYKWWSLEHLSSNVTAMKKSLHRGDAGELNIYATDIVGNNNVYGFATFPWDYADNPELDGVVVDAFTFPGEGTTQHDLGLVAVHEVGHWLGLFHTFEGGCTQGDLIEDTPAESQAHYTCEDPQRDSCPQDPGLDPIRNYMSYGADSCINEFTPGQIQRMRDQFALRIIAVHK